MYDVVVAKPLKNRGILSINPQFERTGETDVFYVRDNLRSLKKVVKYAAGRKIMPDCELRRMKLTSKCVKRYTAVTMPTSLAILEKAVRAVAAKRGLSFPLAEIYVSAPSDAAARIIEKIRGCARLFTVVSPLAAKSALYDELYFKYGTVVRHIPSFCYNEKDDVMIVKGENNAAVPNFTGYPVLNLVRGGSGTNEYNIGSFRVYDGQADSLIRLCGGEPTAELYSFLRIVPKEDASVEINNGENGVFLLDTSLF